MNEKCLPRLRHLSPVRDAVWGSLGGVDGQAREIGYVNDSRLRMLVDDIEDGDTVVVNQMGSGNTVFRSTQEYIYHDPLAENPETALTE